MVGYSDLSSYRAILIGLILNLLPPLGQTNTTRPHHSIARYTWGIYALWGLTCVPVIGTHPHQKYQDYYLDTIGSSWTADPQPASTSALFLRFPQAEPCRSPDNGSYPLSTGVQTQVHIWVPPTFHKSGSKRQVSYPSHWMQRTKWAQEAYPEDFKPHKAWKISACFQCHCQIQFWELSKTFPQLAQ